MSKNFTEYAKSYIKSVRRWNTSTFDKACNQYAAELLDEFAEDHGNNSVPTKKDLLNGAADWREYSYGGCSLIFDEDIAKRVCTPAQFAKKFGKKLANNETWLDVQAQALSVASQRILEAAEAFGKETEN